LEIYLEVYWRYTIYFGDMGGAHISENAILDICQGRLYPGKGVLGSISDIEMLPGTFFEGFLP